MLADIRTGQYEPWICMSDYLVAHVAELLTKTRDEGKTVPLRFEEVDEQGIVRDTKWDAYLTSLIERLEAYDVDDPIAYMHAQGALHEIVSNLSDFWD